MHKIERAIILGAGLGDRLHPITLKTPKPLVKVNGTRIIDTIIDALHKNDIYEIYIVVGYKKEQFYEWARQNNNITLIENNLYNTCNNISSLYFARQHINNCIIMDGDQIIYNSNILGPHFDKSGYSCAYSKEQTNEWILQVDKNNKVTSCSRTGGTNGWQLFSISRWNSEDGKKLQSLLEYEFETNNNRQIYWDDVAMFYHFSKFDLSIYPIEKSDIVEIDSYAELLRVDPSYKKELNYD